MNCNTRRFGLTGLVWLLGLALAVASCGPPRNAAITFTHPSPLLRFGRKLSVHPLTNDDSNVSALMLSVVHASNAFEVTADENGPQMVLSGEVLRAEIGQEQESSRPFTCHRTITERRTIMVPIVVTDPRPYTPPGEIPPPATTHIESQPRQIDVPVRQDYGCTQLVRGISAAYHAHVRVIARTRPIRVVYERDFDLNDQEVTTGLVGSDSDDHPAPPVSGPALLLTLQRRMVLMFARTALPRRESVQVELESCADERCASAIVFARSGSYADAERVFTSVITSMGEPTDTRGRERLAPVLFNRGIVRGYATNLAGGIADITRAIELHPSSAGWPVHLRTLQALLAEEQAAQDRGETRSSEPPRPAGRRPAGARRR